MRNIIRKKIEEQNIIWFKKSNSYLILDTIVAQIIEKLNKNDGFEKIFDWTKAQINAPEEIVKKFIENTIELFHQYNKKVDEKKKKPYLKKVKNSYKSKKYYCINNYIFFIQFQNEYLESQIHPTFAHLEIEKKSSFDINYQVYEKGNEIIFSKKNQLIGKWDKKKSHVFQGKLSMQILIEIYKKQEKNWLGVFHASAVSDGKESLLFLGDSGNGKSTSLALLSANGFDCIADDFAPIDNKKNMYTYPAAISIKEKSVSTLLPYYAELKHTSKHYLIQLNKVVRYLPPKQINYNVKLKCKALIFIKYNPKVELELNQISKINAFQHLIPDSWISPIYKNAEVFLEWFLELPCYQLTYSNNSKMIATVSKIFKDDL